MEKKHIHHHHPADDPVEVREHTRSGRNVFILWIIGLGSLVWLLLRSGLKPWRLAYPCQQVAIANSLGFVVYLTGLLGSTILLRRFKRSLSPLTLALLVVGLLVTALLQGSATTLAQPILAASPPLTTRVSATAVSNVFAVTNVPEPQYSLNGGTIPGGVAANEALHDDGVDALVNLMEAKGDYFYKTAAHPNGLFVSNDVVVIKVSNQWGDRNGTNSDVLKGVIHRLASHPDGFTGAVIVAENTQSKNNDWDNETSNNNSQFQNQSYQEVIQAFADQGYHVCISDWNAIRGAPFVSDYPNNTNGYVLDAGDNKLSYPKFQVDCNGLPLSVSMKNGLWSGSAFDNTRLKMINLPVLKRHGSHASTIAVKNYLGFVTTANPNLTGEPGIHCWLMSYGASCSSTSTTYGLIGRQMHYIRHANLNIVDAIWVNTCSNDQDLTESRRQDVLLASRDPFAVDYYASDFVLGPLVQQYSSSCWRNPDYRQSEASYPGGVFRTIQMRNVASLRAAEGSTHTTINMADSMTRDQELAQFSVYVADANSPTPTATNTPIPTDTPAATDIPTNTPAVINTATNTPIPPTNTPTAANTATNTPIPPTNTPTAANTATNTPLPSTSMPTATATVTNTATNTPVPPTSTPTATNTATNTPIPPTNTPPATATPAATIQPGEPQTITLVVDNSSDDAYSGNGGYNDTSYRLSIGSVGGTIQTSGWRFTNVPIPQGATIQSAHMELVKSGTAWITWQFNWFGETSGDADTFSSGNTPEDRSRTTATVYHNDNIQHTESARYELDQISNIVQEIVNQPSWYAGNDLVIIARTDENGWARKYWYTYDNDPADAAYLVVTYILPAPTATPISAFTPTSTSTPSNSPTPTATNTPLPPTPTDTPVPSTSTPPATVTVTNTTTNTPIPSTSTPTATNIATNTPVPPTATHTATNTPIPPTNTPPATATPTATSTPIPAAIVVDNMDSGFSSQGSWILNNDPGFPFYGTNFLYSFPGSGANQAVFRPNLPVAGDYEVYVWYGTTPSGATNQPFIINYAGGSTTILINMNGAPSAARWRSLGVFSFAAGTSGNVTTNNNANSVVGADAVQWVQ